MFPKFREKVTAIADKRDGIRKAMELIKASIGKPDDTNAFLYRDEELYEDSLREGTIHDTLGED